jgi:D-sedoheptulose 7-phosphate isomerase
MELYMNLIEIIHEEHIKAVEYVKKEAAVLEKIASIIIEAINKGNKVLFAGNGGSAADCQHFAAEMSGRFMKERRGLPGIALTTDTSALTAIANDYGYENVFSRQVEALAKPGDVFVCFSTSGNSPNIFKAADRAQEIGCKTIGFLGKDGGTIKSKCNISFVVPAPVTARIQEAHLLAYHIVCEIIDNSF